MPKPSIFSKNYEKKMRKRRRARIIIIASILLIALCVVLFKGNVFGKQVKVGFNNVKRKISFVASQRKTNKPDAKKKTAENINANNKNSNNDSNKKPNEDNQKIEAKEGNYNISLSNGESVILSYNIVNNIKQYYKVSGNMLSYDISPSKKKVVIIEKSTQNMILVDENGNKKDITKKEYVSTKGEVFKKDNILKNNTSYIWCDSPKFLNEDNIIYISQLPWFNKKDKKYIWKYTISTDNHNNNISISGGELSGTDIKYGNIAQDGLEVIIDGEKSTIK